MKKRILATLLTLCLVVGLLPVTAMAADISVETEAELLEAIAEATGTETKPTEITIENNLTLTQEASIQIPEGTYVTIMGADANTTLTRQTAGTFFAISGETGGLAFESIIIDGTVDEVANKCSIYNAQGNTTAKSGPVIELRNGAKLLNGVQNNSQNYAVTKMYSGSLIDNSLGSQGGAINLWNYGKFYMYGGTISNCRSTNNSGAVDANTGSIVEINGGIIEKCRNSGNAYGGAIALRGAPCTMTINGGTIRENTGYGYVAVYNTNGSTLIMNGGSIVENTKRSNSSHAAEGPFTEITGGTIANNVSYSRVKSVSGTPVLDNVILAQDENIKVNGKLKSGAAIDINISSARTIAEGDGYDLTASDLQAFSSKNADYVLYLDKEANAIKAVEAKVITFSANGGADDDYTQVVAPGIETALDKNTFTRPGYTFTGWNTTADGSDDSYEDGEEVAISADLTLYAQWELINYDITYDLDGGVVDGENPDSYNVESQDIVLANPTKAYHNFKGWSGTGLTGSENKSVVISTGSTGNRSYTANWTPYTYTIKFNASGGDGEMADMEDVAYGSAVNLRANSFTKAGMQFVGWTTGAGDDAAAAEYADKAPVKNLTKEENGEVTLYAVWADKDILDPDVTPQHKTYNGKPQAFTLEGGFTITYKQDEQVVTAPTDAGIYDVVIKKEETATSMPYDRTVEKGLVIEKANVENTAKTNVHHTVGTDYDVTGLFHIDANAGDAAYALVESSAAGAGTATLDGTTLTVTKAGTVKVTLTTAATENYNAGEAVTATLYVDKIDPQPTIKANGKTALSVSGGRTVTLTLANIPDGLTVTVNYINDADSGNVIPVEPVDGVYSVTLPNESATYTFTVETAATDNYAMGVGSCTVAVSRSSGGGSSGGGSSSNTSTSTTKNPDGSTTTTTTDKTTGAVTEVTKETDGTTTTVETKKDGTVTETVKTTDGTTGTVVTDTDGNVTEVKGTVSAAAAKEAGKTGGAVTLPVEVPSANGTKDAPAVEITMPKSAGSVNVEIPVEKVTPGTVAVIVNADGTEKIVSTSVVTENGVALALSGSTTVKVFDNAKSFTDVPVTNVFYNEICSLSAREIMVGKTDEKFDLHSSVTLNQIANVAGRITGAVDVKDYNAGIAWGAENGLKGGNTEASRGDVLKALYVAAGSPAVADTSILDRFKDAASIPADLTAAAAWAAQNGILKGDTSGNANLSTKVTRGQACALAGRTMGTLA